MFEVEKNILYGGPVTYSYDTVKSIGYFLIDLLKRHEDKVVLIDGITDEHVTYKQLLSDIIVVAKCLKAAGLKTGDTIGIVSENRLEFPIPLLAALLIGATVAPMNATYTDRELLHAFGLSRPKIIFTSPVTSKKVIYAASKTNFVKSIIQFGDKLFDSTGDPLPGNIILFKDFVGKYKESNPTEFEPATVNIKEHNAFILCSSGTTGQPKGVQLTHFNILVTQDLFIKRTEAIVDINILGLLPFFHAFGCLVLFGTLITGGKLIIIPRFEEKLFLSSIEKYKISLLFIVPPLMVFLAKHPIVGNYDLSTIQELNIGGAPLSAETIDAVHKRLNNNVNIRQGYGMSETTLSVITQWTDIRKPGSVGILYPGLYCKVVEPETGKILGKYQAGELCFKGPQIMKGYIGNDEATRNTIIDGWLHTGDIGYYDDDFHFFIVDRLKELIKYKGFQVAPAELEAILLTNPKIKDAAVIGLADEASGELPIAFVVVQPNVSLTEKDVIKYVEDLVSPAKRLRGGVRFLHEIPKNPSGKILRRELRALLAKSKL